MVAKRLSFIPTRRVSEGFWETLGNAKTQSLADASGWDRHKFASSKRISEGSSYRRGKLRLKSPEVSWCRFAMPCRGDGAKRQIRGAANFAGAGRGCPCRSCHFQELHRQEVHLETVSGNERRGRHLNREEKVQRPLHDLNLSSLLC